MKTDCSSFVTFASMAATRASSRPGSVDLIGAAAALREGQCRGSLREQLEIHHYGRPDFNRIAIQKRWAVAPLTDSFDSGTREFGVDLGVHHAQRQWITKENEQDHSQK